LSVETREVSSTTSENVLRSWKSPALADAARGRTLERVLHFLLEDAARAAQLAQLLK
jgi:hypothetical protein